MDGGISVRFIGGRSHQMVEWVRLDYDGAPPPYLRRRHPVRISHDSALFRRGADFPQPSTTYETREEIYRLIGARAGVAVYLHEQTALDFAEAVEMKKCEVCGETHAVARYFGMPMMACPELGHDEVRISFPAPVVGQDRWGIAGVGNLDVRDPAIYAPSPTATGEQVAAQQSSSLAAVMREYVDDCNKELNRLLNKEPEENARITGIPAKVDIGLDELRADIRSYSYGTWVCANHPPGFEIKYPLSTLKCEVCGTPQGEG